MPRCAARGAVLCVLALGLLSACSADDGQVPTDRPSVTASLSPTRTLPSPTRSEVVPDETEPASPRPSRSLTLSPDETTPPPTAPSTQEPEPKSEQPTARTSTVIAVPVPSANSPTPTPSSSPSTAGEASGTAEEEPVPTAVWVAPALLAVAAAVGTWLLLRARKRRSWLKRLEITEGEVAWFAQELIPQLRASGSIDQIVGGWQVAVPRVASAEDQLTVLESSARGQTDAARALQLRDAVRSARRKIETLAGPGSHDEWALDLDDVEAGLAAVLGPVDRSTIPAR